MLRDCKTVRLTLKGECSLRQLAERRDVCVVVVGEGESPPL